MHSKFCIRCTSAANFLCPNTQTHKNLAFVLWKLIQEIQSLISLFLRHKKFYRKSSFLNGLKKHVSTFNFGTWYMALCMLILE